MHHEQQHQHTGGDQHFGTAPERPAVPGAPPPGAVPHDGDTPPERNTPYEGIPHAGTIGGGRRGLQTFAPSNPAAPFLHRFEKGLS
ncbi:hypothetical protein Saso_29090 [Streptomyces asoensis]|uniref:Uncharacterized protein n=1 Tax=Streptomyces asoensis TaxID=249586 RepID=A0ABQ3RZJ4_9ACTN|nr:hypothetical protein GCM10010496_10670 [Streptomyces asoensis]GHI61259.1 hypothetical protein Saso_29090 [Streptomyces asoensis]